MPIGPDGSEGPHDDNIVPSGELIGHGASAIAWTGSELGIISIVGASVLLRTYEPTSGAVKGPYTLNTSSGTWTGEALVWTGDRFLAAWSASNNTYMREISATGAPLTPELLESTTAGSVFSLVASPTHYVAATVNGTSQPAVVVVDRVSMAPTTTLIDSPPGGDAQVVMRSDGTFAASSSFFMTGKLQLLSTSATLMGPGVTYPVSDASGFQVALQPTPSGYRITTITVTATRMVQRVELDTAGAIIGTPTPLGSFTATSSGAPSALAVADRSLFAVPYDSNTNPYHLRLIQTCP